jgi:hypothetical protein
MPALAARDEMRHDSIPLGATQPALDVRCELLGAQVHDLVRF